MGEETKQEEYTIDATRRSLGRIASEAAVLLMGKNRTDFVRHAIPNVRVTIENASKANISSKKKLGKVYVWNTGYPGGKREEKLGHRIIRKGHEDVFRKAVYGMLPANKLRARMMKHLNVEG